jgi:hypothetical protein
MATAIVTGGFYALFLHVDEKPSDESLVMGDCERDDRCGEEVRKRMTHGFHISFSTRIALGGLFYIGLLKKIDK